MSIDRDLLTAGLATLRKSGEGVSHHGHFPDLIADTIGKEEAPLDMVSLHVTRINQALWGVFTSAERVEWQRKMFAEGHLPGLTWIFFAGADVTLFHVTLRSLFDHVAKLIGLCADKRGTVPDDSFRELKNWAAKPGNDKRLGEDLRRLVLSADWFDAMRDVRDSIVHHGGQPIILPPEKGLWFQVTGARVKGVLEPGLMPNENVVDFELYAGKYLGYTLGFLDRLAAIARQRYGRPQYSDLAWASSGGMSTVRGWIERVLQLPTTR